MHKTEIGSYSTLTLRSYSISSELKLKDYIVYNWTLKTLFFLTIQRVMQLKWQLKSYLFFFILIWCYRTLSKRNFLRRKKYEGWIYWNLHRVKNFCALICWYISVPFEPKTLEKNLEREFTQPVLPKFDAETTNKDRK